MTFPTASISELRHSPWKLRLDEAGEQRISHTVENWRRSGCYLCPRSVTLVETALLVFLPAAARTRVIPTNVFLSFLMYFGLNLERRLAI